MALGVSDDVASIEVLTPAMLVALGEKGVKTLDDLADLASDELVEIVGAAAMDEDTANQVIMAARAHWFDGEDADPGALGRDADADALGKDADAGTVGGEASHA